MKCLWWDKQKSSEEKRKSVNQSSALPLKLKMICNCLSSLFLFSLSADRILALEKLGAVFNQVAFPLQYTPRKFVIHPETNNLILIETDHNAYTEATKAQRKQQMAEVWSAASMRWWCYGLTDKAKICSWSLTVIHLSEQRDGLFYSILAPENTPLTESDYTKA